MGFRLIVINRTLNEIRNIERFCQNYSFADKILITDGGSTDGTVEAARKFANVEVRDVSHLQIEIDGYGVITPESNQTNIGVAWAKEEGADWIIKDECDCWPNSHLRHEARRILETVDQPSVFVYRLYLWMEDEYFPRMNRSGQSLWAWRPDTVNVYADESRPFAAGLRGLPPKNERANLELPYACLHHFCPDYETFKHKLAYKKAMGKNWVYPPDSIYVPAEKLPEEYL